jgi:hypothetical protein
MDQFLNQVRTILATTPTRWMNLVEATPTELLTQPPLPGEWSAMECLLHLLDTERGVFPVRIKALLKGEDFPGFNPDREGTRLEPDSSPVGLAEEFARLRKVNLALLTQVNPADLDRTARHKELGMVTMRELLNEWVAHDLNHTVQAERALMQPFIHGCGPWATFFTDHVARPNQGGLS